MGKPTDGGLEEPRTRDESPDEPDDETRDERRRKAVRHAGQSLAPERAGQQGDEADAVSSIDAATPARKRDAMLDVLARRGAGDDSITVSQVNAARSWLAEQRMRLPPIEPPTPLLTPGFDDVSGAKVGSRKRRQPS